MESGLSVVPILSHARNTKQWLPLDLKRQTLRPSKVGKIHRKSSASMRVRCENAKDGRIEMDRRRLLLSSSTLGVSALTSSKAQSKPFPAPELLQCQYPTALPEGARVEGRCCPPFTRETPVDFTFPTSIPMRKRKAAHLLDIESIEKYDKALKLMKNLPPEDPRSFTQQAKVHCAYCNGAYTVGSGILAVHGSWLFAPFHRWYIYFYERILGSLIHDDTFALPFWNWDAEEGMQIPPIYADKCRYFYDKNRDECHQAPVIINLKSPKSCESGLVEANYSTINTQMKADTALTFHGGPIRYEEESSEMSSGTLEASAHGLVHAWTGSFNNPKRENMGTFYSAGRDPLFYSHHCNVDCMWSIWNDKLGNTNWNDKDLTETEFLFYNEKEELVKVKVGDCYDTSKLGYQYQELELPWLAYGRSLKKAGKVMPKSKISAFRKLVIDEQPKKLSSPLSVRVERPNKILRKRQVEVLKIEGLEPSREGFSGFDIFINYPDADSTTPLNSLNYAGTFASLGHDTMKGESMKSMTSKESFKIGISETLEDLGIGGDDEIIVTLVPKASKGLPETPITFTSIKIEFIDKYY